MGFWRLTVSYKIGSFNMYKFTAYQSDQEIRKDLDKIANIIHTEKYDVVAMQEVFNPKAAEMVRARLGFDWEMAWAQPPSINRQAAEGYAYIWNKRRLQPIKTITEHGRRTFEPRIFNQYIIDKGSGQIPLERNPYYARFTPNGLPGGSFFEIRLINAHIMFSSSNEEVDLGITMMRKNEFRVLAETIYSKISDKRYGDNMPAYTILLGDFNLNLNRPFTKSPYLEEVFEIPSAYGRGKIIRTVQENLSTIKNPQNESGYANNYDHFTYDLNRFSGTTIKADSVAAVEKYCGGDYAKYKKEVSDHVPVSLTINLK